MNEADALGPGSTRIGRRRSAGEESGEPDPAPVGTTETSVSRRRTVQADPEDPVAATETSMGRRRRMDPGPDDAVSATDTAVGWRREGQDRPGLDATDASRGTTLGRRRENESSSRAGEVVVRFGPGVPSEPAPTPSWGAPTTGKRSRGRRWSAGLLTLGVVAGVVAWLLLAPTRPMTVTGATVEAAVAPGACDVVVDVVGTVATDGRPGTLRYQWLRSDGRTTPPQTQTVASGATSTEVRLQWSVAGRGRLPATATLRVLDPTPVDATGGFTYSCP